MGDLMMKDIEKKDWLGVCFALVVTHKFCFQASCISVAVWGRETLPVVDGAGTRGHFSKPDI